MKLGGLRAKLRFKETNSFLQLLQSICETSELSTNLILCCDNSCHPRTQLIDYFLHFDSFQMRRLSIWTGTEHPSEDEIDQEENDRSHLLRCDESEMINHFEKCSKIRTQIFIRIVNSP
jgi:hypothetical protein